MAFHPNMSVVERIEYLEGIAVLLHQSIYESCAVSGVDIESIDLANPASWESIVSEAVNTTYTDWIARQTLIREIPKLNTVNKKLDELKNA